MAFWHRIEEDIDPVHRLGRHIDRPDDFNDRLLTATDEPQSKTWTRHVGPFNQGAIGSCCGNASAGVLMTDPFYSTIVPPATPFGEPEAVTIYSAATHFNGQPNDYYPPNDTGSSGPAAAQACEQLGFISGYSHTVDLPTSLTAFLTAPGIFGVNWMTSFDTPLPTGECPLTAGATVRGGHEIQSWQVDVPNQRLWFWQSWGNTWGGLGNGSFWLSFQTMNSLFKEGADGTFFVPKGSAQ